MTTNADLAAQITDLITKWGIREDQMHDWLGGTVDGGPNNDGKYPLTDAGGTTYLVECPALLADNVTGPTALAEAAKVAAETARDAAVSAQTAVAADASSAATSRADAIAARDLAQTYRDDTAADKAAVSVWHGEVETARDTTVAAKDETLTARDETVASASTVGTTVAQAAAAIALTGHAQLPEYADPDTGYAAVAEGERFVVPQAYGDGHYVFQRVGPDAVFDGVTAITQEAREVAAAMAHLALNAPQDLTHNIFFAGSRLWDGRLAPNLAALGTPPTLNMCAAPVSVRDEQGDTNPPLTQWVSGVTDPDGNSDVAFRCAPTSTAHLLATTNLSTLGGAPSGTVRLRMSLKSELSTELMSVGRRNITSEYEEKALSTSWAEWNAAFTFPNTAGVQPGASATLPFEFDGAVIQLYDDVSGAIPSRAEEIAASAAGHAKPAVAHRGAIHLDATGTYKIDEPTVDQSRSLAIEVSSIDLTGELTFAAQVDQAALSGQAYEGILTLTRQPGSASNYLDAGLHLDGLTGELRHNPVFSELAGRSPNVATGNGPVHVAMTVKDNGDGTFHVVPYINGVRLLTSTESMARDKVDILVMGAMGIQYSAHQSNQGAIQKLASCVVADRALSGNEVADLFKATQEAISITGGATVNRRFFSIYGADSNTQSETYSPMWSLQRSTGWAYKSMLDAVGGSKYGTGAFNAYDNPERQALRRGAIGDAVRGGHEIVPVHWQYGVNDIEGGVMDPANDGAAGAVAIDAMILADALSVDPALSHVRNILYTCPPKATWAQGSAEETVREAHNANRRANSTLIEGLIYRYDGDEGHYMCDLDALDVSAYGFVDLEAAARDALANGANALYQADGIHFTPTLADEIRDQILIPLYQIMDRFE